MAIIGDQFDDCRGVVKTDEKAATASAATGKLDEEIDGIDGTDWPEICGCTISVRQSEDIVTVWNRVDGDLKVREQIRYVYYLFFYLAPLASYSSLISDTLRRVLNLPSSTIMEYKSNNGEHTGLNLL